jgi:hypothetical protein
MEQSLELEGNKINSLLVEMTDIVRKLRGHKTNPSHADATMMHGGAPKTVSQAEASRRAAN